MGRKPNSRNTTDFEEQLTLGARAFSQHPSTIKPYLTFMVRAYAAARAGHLSFLPDLDPFTTITYAWLDHIAAQRYLRQGALTREESLSRTEGLIELVSDGLSLLREDKSHTDEADAALTILRAINADFKESLSREPEEGGSSA